MKAFRRIVVLMGLGLLVWFALSRVSVPSAEAPLGPREVTTGFYERYLDYIASGEGDSPRNPLVNRAYRSMPGASPELARKVDGIVASFENGGYDPFLCAQDVPEWIEATEVAREEGRRSTVEVRTSLEGHAFTVELEERGGQWLMTDVRCH